MTIRRLLLGCLFVIACSCSGPNDKNQDGQNSISIDALINASEKGAHHVHVLLNKLSEEDRMVTIQQLLNEHPQASTLPLCDYFSGERLKTCRNAKTRVAERPHLWGEGPKKNRTTTPPPPAGTHPRPTDKRLIGTGPKSTRIRIQTQIQSPLLSHKALPIGCEQEDHDCRLREAIAALREQRLEWVAGICINPSEKWQSECFFRAGEQQAKLSTEKDSERTIGQAIALCLAAGEFLNECVQQSLIAHEITAPSSLNTDKAVWQHFIAQIQSFTDASLEIPAHLQDELQQRYFARILFNAYHASDTLTGNPTSQLPQSALPHLRATVAYFLVEHLAETQKEWGQDPQSLLKWGRLVNQVVAGKKSSPKKKKKPYPPTVIKDYWQEDTEGEEDKPALPYLGKSRRTWSKNAEIDAQICVLEALARHNTGLDLLRSATRHAEPQIVWTAVRLLNLMSR